MFFTSNTRLHRSGLRCCVRMCNNTKLHWGPCKHWCWMSEDGMQIDQVGTSYPCLMHSCYNNSSSCWASPVQLYWTSLSSCCSCKGTWKWTCLVLILQVLMLSDVFIGDIKPEALPGCVSQALGLNYLAAFETQPNPVRGIVHNTKNNTLRVLVTFPVSACGRSVATHFILAKGALVCILRCRFWMHCNLQNVPS